MLGGFSSRAIMLGRCVRATFIFWRGCGSELVSDSNAMCLMLIRPHLWYAISATDWTEMYN